MNEITVVKQNGLMPETFGEKLQMAGILVKSNMLPRGIDTPEKAVVALQWGAEIGLSPMVALNNIAVINNKPTLSADIMHAVVRANPQYEGIKWVENSDKKAKCIIKRRLNSNIVEEYVGEFSIEDAKNAGLLEKDNWKKYPVRMLKHRALSFALRDAFPDVLAGCYSTSEMQDVQNEINITEEAYDEKEQEEVPVSHQEEKAGEKKEKPVMPKEVAAKLKTMFSSGLLTAEEHDDAIDLFNSGKITPEQLLEEVTLKYEERGGK